MPMWRCPHCGTPQAETARCWVCHRSSTACATCRHFRRSVAAQIGYCALDRRREPLVGDEIRACWDAAPVMPEPTLPEPVLAATDRVSPRGGAAPEDVAIREPTARNARDFVEVGQAPATSGPAPAARSSAANPGSASPGEPGTPAPPAASLPAPEPGWSLWSDLEG